MLECVKFRNEKDLFIGDLVGYLPLWDIDDMVNLCAGGRFCALDSVCDLLILNSNISFMNSIEFIPSFIYY